MGQNEESEDRQTNLRLDQLEANSATFISDGNAGVCAVSLEDTSTGQCCRRLRCLHIFHAACIERWCAERKSCGACPLCKSRIAEGEVCQPQTARPATSAAPILRHA